MKINVNEIFENKLNELESENFVENIISESIENSIKKAVTEAFTNYRTKNKIEEKIQKEIDKSLDVLDFSSYNQFMVNKLQKMISMAKDVDLTDKIKSMLDTFIKPQKNEIKLSDLMEEYRESLLKDSYEDYEYEDCFGFILDESFSLSTHIYIDEKIDIGYGARVKSKYNYKYQITIDNKTRTIEKLEIDGDDTDSILKFGFLDSFEGKLVRAYFNKTKIDIDIDEDEVDTTLYEEY